MDLLKKTLSTTAVCALTAAIAFGGYQAQAETINSTITANVQNAFTFSEVAALDFGTVGAVNHTADTATYLLTPAGVTSVTALGSANIIPITAPTVGSFTISGAAPSTSISLTIPATATLTCGGCGAGTATFSVASITGSSGASITTDGTGAAAFTLGGTLTTVAHATNVYVDGSYTGAVNITAAY